MKVIFKYRGRAIERYPYKIASDGMWTTLMYKDDDPELYLTDEMLNFEAEDGTGPSMHDTHKREHSYHLSDWFRDLENRYGKINVESYSGGGSTRYKLNFYKDKNLVNYFIWDLGDFISFEGPTGRFKIDADLLKASLGDDLLPRFIQN